MKQFGLQLYSVRDAFSTAEGTRQAFKDLKAMGYSYGQTAGVYPGIAPELFAQYAKEADFGICGTHYDWSRIKDDIEGTVNYHRILGTTNVGIGGMPGDARRGIDNLKSFIADFNRLSYEYAKYGMKLTYHNHSFEFVKIDGVKTIFDYLVDGFNRDNISFVLDTYWVQHGGAEIRSTIERLDGRIDILHIKDMIPCHQYPSVDGKTISAPIYGCVGDGNIDFKRIIPLAEECGAKYFVVEDDRCRAGEYMNDTKRSADYIIKNLLV